MSGLAFYADPDGFIQILCPSCGGSRSRELVLESSQPEVDPQAYCYDCEITQAELLREVSMFDDEDFNYVFADTETGGLDAKEHPILEIAAIMTGSAPEFSKMAMFQSYIRPTRKLICTEGARNVHQIDDELLFENAPYARNVATAFAHFLLMSRKPLIFSGHNTPFDVKFCVALLKIAGIKELLWSPTRYHDTLLIAKEDFPEWPSHKLMSVCEQLNIKLSNAHSAFADISATHKAARKMAKRREKSLLTV